MNKKKDGSRFDDLISTVRSRTQEEMPQPTESKPVRKTKSTDPDYIRTTIYLPKQLHKKLKAAAVDEDREMSEIIEELVNQWLKSRENH